MVELGDQMMNFKGFIKIRKNARFLSKQYFETMGFNHTSIDWHGKNGAYPIDLSKPIEDPYWYNRFDILTNFGTSEHVENQYECWKNMHNLVKKNGIFISIIPSTTLEVDIYGNKSPHCNYCYQPQFIKDLSIANSYDIIAMVAISTCGCAGYFYRKLSDEFVTTKEQIDSWIQKVETNDSI